MDWKKVLNDRVEELIKEGRGICKRRNRKKNSIEHA